MFDTEAAANDRHATFVKRVLAAGEVWGLQSADGWAVSPSDDEEREVMPFWSDRAYAAQCAKAEWASYKPASIPLPEFLAAWLPGMTGDGVLVGTNWNAHLNGREIEPAALLDELTKRGAA